MCMYIYVCIYIYIYIHVNRGALGGSPQTSSDQAEVVFSCFQDPAKPLCTHA